MLLLTLSAALLPVALAASIGIPSKSSSIKRGEGFIRAGINHVAGPLVDQRTKRQNAVSVTNEESGIQYTIDIEIGTPPQPVTVILDTGSSELWVNPTCKTSGELSYCQSFKRYDYTASSSFKDAGVANFLSYGSGNVSVEYATEVVSIGSAAIQEQIFGVATESNNIPLGIIGLAPRTSDADIPYPYVLDTMANQGLIKSRAFSLDLRSINDPSGSVVFGGLDTGKFAGQLEKLPMLDPSQSHDGSDRYWIVMTGIGITVDGQSDTSDPFEVGVFLDSGTSISRLPTAIVQAVGDSLGAAFDAESSLYLVPCSVADTASSVDFIFNSKVISVALSDFILKADAETCILGISPDDNDPVLGDTFLRAAYVVYDQDNRNLHLAQAANCGEKLVAIGSGVNAVPSVTGDCSDTAAGATATATRTFAATQTRSPTNLATTHVAAPTIGGGPGPEQPASSSFTGSLPNPTASTASAKPSSKNKAGSIGVGGAALAALAAGFLINAGAWLL